MVAPRVDPHENFWQVDGPRIFSDCELGRRGRAGRGREREKEEHAR